MKNDVILIRPPRISSDRAYISLQTPLNLGYLAAYLIRYGFRAQIWDFEIQSFGEEFIQKVKKLKNHFLLFGITAFTPTVNNAHKIAKTLKEEFPDIPIVLGGPHASVFPEETLREFPYFDIAVIGEGEETLKEVCERIKKNQSFERVKGIAYRKNNEIVRGQDREVINDLDSIPFPARYFFDNKLYRGHHVSRAFSRRFLNIAELITSRGCPYSCIFCGRPDRKVCLRSVPNILAEVEECVNKYHIDHFSILDDIFSLKEDRVIEFCQGIKKIKDISWDCYCRVDSVSEGLLKQMVNAGCQKISFGIESGSQRILDLIKKGITLEQVKKVFRWAHRAGLKYVEASFMIGSHPDETRGEIDLTCKLIKEIKPDILMLTVAIPYPGSPLFKIMLERDYLKKEFRWEEFTFSSNNLHWRTKYFDPVQLISMRNSILNKFYLRFGYIIKKLINIKRINEFMYWKDIGLDFLKK